MFKGRRLLFLVVLGFLLVTPCYLWAYRGARSVRAGGTVGHRGATNTSSFRPRSPFSLHQRSLRTQSTGAGRGSKLPRSRRLHTRGALRRSFRGHPRKKTFKRIWVHGSWVEGEPDVVILTTDAPSSPRDPEGPSPKSTPSDASEVWVPGKWVESEHGVLIWQGAHWKVIESDARRHRRADRPRGARPSHGQ